MNEKNKVELLTPYMNWKILTSNPTEEEIGREFDRMYDKSETELNVYYNIYKKKLNAILETNGENQETT